MIGAIELATAFSATTPRAVSVIEKRFLGGGCGHIGCRRDNYDAGEPHPSKPHDRLLISMTSQSKLELCIHRQYSRYLRQLDQG
jgi:hypothetical protein